MYPQHFSTAPSIFTAGRTVVLPPKRPELRCDSAVTCSGLVSSLLAAPQIATTAFVRSRRFIYPSEFGSDADGAKGTGRRSFFRFNSSTLEFIRCSLHHGFRSHVAADHMSLVFRREWCTFQ